MVDNLIGSSRNDLEKRSNNIWVRMHIDITLVICLFLTLLLSLVVLYSASGQHPEMLVNHIMRTGFAFFLMIAAAQLKPKFYVKASVFLYIGCLILLILVDRVGEISKGAQRWLNIGFTRIQPSEFLKVVLPLSIAAFLARDNIPPKNSNLIMAFILLIVPVGLILKQPDLGTAILVGVSGFIVIFCAGLSFWLIGIGILGFLGILPILWNYVLHDYQKQRVLTLLNPESDPLGAGYHIIQSKIAIGSGGVFGKGWLDGTQSQLEFLPEPHTDFIFAVLAEEGGLIAFLLLMTIYIAIVSRCAYITYNAKSNFEKTLGASFTFTFVFYIFVNIGMVSGILPVVGVPLPMISYGGTSMVTLGICFGMLMSFHTHKKNLIFRK